MAWIPRHKKNSRCGCDWIRAPAFSYCKWANFPLLHAGVGAARRTGTTPESTNLAMADSERENGESAGAVRRFESIVPVLLGAIVVIAAGWGLAVAAPASDPSYTQPTSVAEQKKSAATPNTQESRGRKLYISQGCYSCHTQQVRAVITDAYLGPASRAGDYAYDDPVLLGAQRIGPDLSHIGSREPGNDKKKLTDYLRDPQKDRPFSTMPSYAHLSDEEMSDLVAYLRSLE